MIRLMATASTVNMPILRNLEFCIDDHRKWFGPAYWVGLFLIGYISVSAGMDMHTERSLSGASPLPPVKAVRLNKPVGSKAIALLLVIRGRPVKPRWPNAGFGAAAHVPKPE